MSIMPPRPDASRHCFRPCSPGMFCKCQGKTIPKRGSVTGSSDKQGDT